MNIMKLVLLVPYRTQMAQTTHCHVSALIVGKVYKAMGEGQGSKMSPFHNIKILNREGFMAFSDLSLHCTL